MTTNQINKLRDTFRVAMLDWDVPVSVTTADGEANVSFRLWGTQIEGTFIREGGKWNVIGDCPHHIANSVSAWQWIAMKLHDKLTA